MGHTELVPSHTFLPSVQLRYCECLTLVCKDFMLSKSSAAGH